MSPLSGIFFIYLLSSIFHIHFLIAIVDVHGAILLKAAGEHSCVIAQIERCISALNPDSSIFSFLKTNGIKTRHSINNNYWIYKNFWLTLTIINYRLSTQEHLNFKISNRRWDQRPVKQGEVIAAQEKILGAALHKVTI